MAAHYNLDRSAADVGLGAKLLLEHFSTAWNREGFPSRG